MPRICFTLQVDREQLAAYGERHAAVWPEMLEALDKAGWRQYSLFLREDGLLIGYFETDDLDAALKAMDQTDVNRRWQDAMAPFFRELDGIRPDEGIRPIPEIFNLEAQLMKSQQTGESP